ncbi:hypothetical protein COU78_00475 [Candidatus Peregrinibacteria bacterium CG10_big_fil_rev_8_21_14_0_10_49_24]|nr:MAG: hypothetical protein COV83_06520 [Candidatus Peregrinibacteria bacterium CG11_big_fil_rev_8_21_14_0_20_49_14]PIR51662.1 MAG: hypothetical protein COU78_00475 [Candidatus Peregrinibacteria bacterium CG10_big_fil_rev_8_21_14_0_10_49_24]PJA67978.1 MAG: hypothetical protein CO157_01485 [Candidatus Peregrinibacteria bacterium CG_4_9_14_3_um_filter_49_12]
MHTLYLIINGIGQALRSTRRKFLFLGLTLLMFLILFSTPILTIQGNSLAFQLSITRGTDVAILLLLSSLLSLVIILQLERRRCGKACHTNTASMVGMGSTGVVGTAFAGLLATAACSSCIVGVLGFIGIGSAVAFALLDYRWYIVWAIIVLSVLFIMLTAKSIGRTFR